MPDKLPGMKWFHINAKQAADTAQEIFIFGDIGESWFGESITAKQFVDELAALDTALPLTIRINSIGGSVIDGLAIYNAIKRHEGDVTVTIEGIAASIAGLIAMAGDTVEIAENARLMVHAPWGSTAGNAQKLRQYADQLDAWSESMCACYVAKTGKPRDEMLALLKDGTDHWYSADEALAEGFADTVGPAVKVAASLDISRYTNARPQASVVKPPKENRMTEAEIRAAAEAKAAADAAQAAAIQTAAAAAAQAALAADADRRAGIQSRFAPFASFPGAGELLAKCQADHKVSPQDAGEQLLVLMGKNAQPANGGFVYTVEAEADKQIKATTAAIEARAGMGVDDTANAFRSFSLIELARSSLARAGVRDNFRDKMGLVASAFTHTGSDFPKILESIATKAMLKGYDEAAETFQLWTVKGSLPDFKTAKRVDLNTFPALTSVAEGAEFQYATIGERGESIVLGTYGKLFSISRQAIINDDLSAFTRIPQRMGRAAKRTVGDGVYAVLTGNPTMADGDALFHANHGNIGTGAVISTDSVSEMRTKMARQAVDGVTVNMRMAHLIVPVTLQDRASVVRASQYHYGASTTTNTIPNAVQNTFDVIADPRLDANSTAKWYAAADGGMFDTIEVAYLDGNETPFLDRKEGWNVDGVELKVRHDFGVKALDFRSMGYNAGS